MNIIIKATNMELTDSIREYVYKKFEGVEKFMSHSQEDKVLYVDVGKISNHHKSGHIFRAEVSTSWNGRKYYALSEDDDLYGAIDGVWTEIIREFNSKKGKMRTLFKKGALKVKWMMKGIPYFGKKFK